MDSVISKRSNEASSTRTTLFFCLKAPHARYQKCSLYFCYNWVNSFSNSWNSQSYVFQWHKLQFENGDVNNGNWSSIVQIFYISKIKLLWISYSVWNYWDMTNLLVNMALKIIEGKERKKKGVDKDNCDVCYCFINKSEIRSQTGNCRTSDALSWLRLFIVAKKRQDINLCVLRQTGIQLSFMLK